MSKKVLFFVLLILIFSLNIFSIDVEKFLLKDGDLYLISKNMDSLNEVVFSSIGRIYDETKNRSEWGEIFQNNNLKKFNCAICVKLPDKIGVGSLLFEMVLEVKDKKSYRDLKDIFQKKFSLIKGEKLADFFIFSGGKKNIQCAFNDEKNLVFVGNGNLVKEGISSFLSGGGFDIREKREILENLDNTKDILSHSSLIFVDFRALEEAIDYLSKSLDESKKLKSKSDSKDEKNPFGEMFANMFTGSNVKNFFKNCGVMDVKYLFFRLKDGKKSYSAREFLKVESNGDTLIKKILDFYVSDRSYEKVINNIPGGYNTVLYGRLPISIFLNKFKEVIAKSFGPQMKTMLNSFLGMADMQTSIYVGLTTGEIMDLLGNDFLYISNYGKGLKNENFGVSIFFPKKIDLLDKMIKALKDMKYKDLNIVEKSVNGKKEFTFSYKKYKLYLLEDLNFFAVSQSEKSLLDLQNALNEPEYGVKKDFRNFLLNKDIVSFGYGDIFKVFQKDVMDLVFMRGKSSSVTALNLKLSPEDVFSNWRYSYVESDGVHSVYNINREYFKGFMDKLVSYFIMKIKSSREKEKELKKSGESGKDK